MVVPDKCKPEKIVFVAISLVPDETKSLFDAVLGLDSHAKMFLEETNVKRTLNSSHETRAHKRSHGVTTIASFGVFCGQQVPVEFTAILFLDRLVVLETHLGLIGNGKISLKNLWPHFMI